MKITIDISNFYFEEGDFQTEFKKYVINQALYEVNKKTQDLILNEITNLISKKIENTLTAEINSYIKELIINNETLIGKEQIPINDFIKKQFIDNSGWSSPRSILEALAKKFGTEMKNRYDMEFASQIVMKMQENGLLKEGVAQMLLNNKKE